VIGDTPAIRATSASVTLPEARRLALIRDCGGTRAIGPSFLAWQAVDGWVDHYDTAK
jgi:hypothetical protein